MGFIVGSQVAIMSVCVLFQALVFAYDFHAGGETMMSRHFNDPNADAYFTKRKWGKAMMQESWV